MLITTPALVTTFIGFFLEDGRLGRKLVLRWRKNNQQGCFETVVLVRCVTLSDRTSRVFRSRGARFLDRRSYQRFSFADLVADLAEDLAADLAVDLAVDLVEDQGADLAEDLAADLAVALAVDLEVDVLSRRAHVSLLCSNTEPRFLPPFLRSTMSQRARKFYECLAQSLPCAP